jgi:zinc/manganese transport system substrate-binding protein
MEKTNKYILGGLAVVLIIIAIAGFALYSNGSHIAASKNTSSSINPSNQNSSSLSNSSSGTVIQVVAAENFWGSLVEQLGGTHVNVTSIVTDPNADPHEYESNAQDARAVANANLVIVNGVGYDDWALKLIAANNNPNQTVLNVAQNLGIANGSNPHLWYNPSLV